MRPILLEMTAFGSYKNPTEIDFESLGRGIYAITGPTGAGKTTIFDAIMFALYEEVSSMKVNMNTNPVDKNSVRSKYMMRSKYVDDDVRTKVMLKFNEGGRQYTVTREIYFAKSNGERILKFSAEINGDDEYRPVKDSKKVTKEVERILGGIDAFRFRQIVMLAQGQFKAFMEAKDEQRGKILRDLFDSNSYLNFQKMLKDVKDSLEKKEEEEKKNYILKLAPDAFELPEGTSEEEKAKYSPDMPIDILKENLTLLINSDEENLKTIMNEGTKLKESSDKLNQEIGKAKEINKQYEEWKTKKEILQKLESRREEMDKLRAERTESEKAVNNVYPCFNEHKNAEKRINDLNSSLKLKNEENETAIKKKEEAEDNAQKIQELEKKSEDILKKIEKIEANKEKFTEFTTTQNNLKNAVRKLADTEENLKKENDLLKVNKKKYEDICNELLSLKDAEVKEVNAKNEYNNSETALQNITDKDKGLKARFEKLLGDEENVGKCLIKVNKCIDEYNSADDEYKRIEKAYYNGYAGRLGIKLEEMLNNEGKAVCPVCNSEFCADSEEHRFARPTDDVPTDEQLQEAKDECNEKEEKKNTAEINWREKNKEFETKRDLLLDNLKSELPGYMPWEWNTDEIAQKLENAVSDAKKKRDENKTKFDKAAKERMLKEQLVKDKDSTDELIKTSEKNISAYKNDKTKFEGDKQRYSDDAERIMSELIAAEMSEYKDKAAAETKINELNTEKLNTDNKIKALNKAVKDTEKKCEKIGGEIDQIKDQLKSASTEYDAAKERYTNKLTETGFGDETAFMTALNRAGSSENERETWIEEKRNEINKYDTDLEKTSERVTELEKEKLKYIDLKELNKKSEELTSQINANVDKEKEADRQTLSHKTALDAIKTASAKLDKITAALKRIRPMSVIANAKGGKHSFEGYILGSNFREMLELASCYLSDMSDGKYVLCHGDGSGLNANSNADFQIDVQDAVTGQTREIGSLSGGEGFQAAMALALGLSDAVQRHHSTVSIDTMFIDEGFGSLDSESLHRMLTVLKKLSGGDRQIAIISHVDELKESILTEKKSIYVSMDPNGKGSKIEIE